MNGAQGQDLLLIASQDCTVSLWSLQGALVGVMGKQTWTVSDPSTWQDAKVTTPPSIHTYIQFVLAVSPGSAGFVSRPELVHVANIRRIQ